MIRKPNFKLNWKYALGEVALIFIGISLAIAFQNWNEDRKAREFEIEILSEIYTSLFLDSMELVQNRTEYLKADQAASKLLDVDIQQQMDSVPYWLGQFLNFERFNPSSSPYEVLKSEGLQTITSTSLRSNLAEYYDEVVPSITEAFKDVEDDFELNVVDLFKEKFKDFKFKLFAFPRDTKAFMNDESNVVYLKIFRDNRLGALDDIEKGLSIISEIRTEIKQVVNP
ncbi:MAG TPA: hypothetical protein VIN11_08680 [Roseivirga sp.]